MAPTFGISQPAQYLLCLPSVRLVDLYSCSFDRFHICRKHKFYNSLVRPVFIWTWRPLTTVLSQLLIDWLSLLIVNHIVLEWGQTIAQFIRGN